MQGTPKTALVLSGGGVRGAYEVGVVSGIMRVLGIGVDDPPPFQLFAGTSVGAINAAYMVSRAERGDLGIDDLAELWKNLDVGTHMRLQFGSRQSPLSKKGAGLSKSLIDSRPLEVLVRRSIDWAALHANIRRGNSLALLVAAFNLVSSRTAIFVEKHASVEFSLSPDPMRQAHLGEVTSDHILASAAVPLMFPARPLAGSYYCDGGIRFNTPFSPAIRAGAERLVVVSLQSTRHLTESHTVLDHEPSPQYIAGKLLNALLLDPFSYDVEVMERFNDLFHVLEEVLPPEELERVHQLMERRRGARYRQLRTLLFSPKRDLGKMANEYLRDNLDRFQIGRIPRFLMRRAALQDATWEADWAAYLLFDGRYAARLIELGREDALSQEDEIRAFFAPDAQDAQDDDRALSPSATHRSVSEPTTASDS